MEDTRTREERLDFLRAILGEVGITTKEEVGYFFAQTELLRKAFTPSPSPAPDVDLAHSEGSPHTPDA